LAITSSAKTIALMQSLSQNVTITVSSVSGLKGIVNLAATVSGTGVTVKLSNKNPSFSNLSDINVRLTVSTTNLTTAGNYTITIVGIDGNLSQSLKIPLHVNPLGDFDGDGFVGIVDISIVAYHYGSTPTSPNWYPLADLNHDGVVNLIDFEIVAANYG